MAGEQSLPALVLRKAQPECFQPLLYRTLKMCRISMKLETRNPIVSVAYHHCISPAARLELAIEPIVEGVVKVDVRQNTAYYAASVRG
jgi:hypothetical protein